MKNNIYINNKLNSNWITGFTDGEGCGYSVEHNNFICYTISNFYDIYLKIIPFFNKYRIIGVKSLYFIDFCLVAELIKNKTHLTKQGLDKVQLLKSGMNNGRYIKSL